MAAKASVHSDLLVHWTGKKDIDPDEKNTKEVEEAYLQRLKDILTYGLWMTDQEPPKINDAPLPTTPCTCFTELKLSQSLSHAQKYGRLGVAFKRPYLFSRSGRPVVYYGTKKGVWMKKDRLLQACARELNDKSLLHFFAPMNETAMLDYELYAESEWRIVYTDTLLSDGKVVNPRVEGTKYHTYWKTLSFDQQQRLRYLIPVDGWLALIIYPTIEMKNTAQSAKSPISDLLSAIKTNPKDRANSVEGGNYPVEIDLDLCRHL